MKNLDNPNYMTLLLDGKQNLEELFASIEPTNLDREIQSKETAERVLPGFRKILAASDLPEHLMRMAVYERQIQLPN